MAVFEVSYDLRKPGRNYQGLYDRLSDWKAFRVLQSVWIINSGATADSIRDDLLKQMDAGDGLLVAELTGTTAWHNLDGQSEQKLRGAFSK
jgi:hypothetical protein